MTSDEKLDFVLSRFTVKSRKSNSALCSCPAHSDAKASLSITAGRKGILLKCFAGCKTEDILDAVGFKMSDLFYDNGKPEKSNWRAYVEAREKKKIEAEYDYQDFEGRYAFTKLRMTGKKMVYGRLENERFVYGLNGKHKKDIQAIYGDTRAIKKTVNDGITVYYVEGEKDVNTLKKHGYVSFTCGGVNDWSAAYAELVRGGNVIILADNDTPGKALASRVWQDVSKVAKTARVIIPVPDVPKADISDFFEEHSKEEFEEILQKSENEENAAEQRSEVNLLKFHIVSEDGKIRRVNDFAVFDYLKHKYDILVIGGVVYIYQGGVFKADQSGARLKTIIRELIFPDFRKAPTINQIFNLFLQDIELETTLDQCNRQPRYWMNFENAYWNLKEQRFEEHNPKYRTLNQLPHKYEPDAGLHGEATDKFLGFVFEKDDNREMALEYACYCGTTDTTQQKFFCFCGIGGTGKSVFLALISKMVGESNISNIGMEELGQKFASFGLLNKLMNCCSELQIEALSDAKTLKQASGEDRIRCEQKGHDAVFERSIAKMIFSTNELPLIKNEKTDAVYRRMLVLPMNKKPDRQNPNLLSELETEIDYFIYLVVQAGQRLYARGRKNWIGNMKKF